MLRIFWFMLFTAVCFKALAGPLPGPAPNHFPVLQVIQDAFTLDNTTVENAGIIMSAGNHYGGLHVELKPQAAKVFREITTAGKGRRMNVIFNNVLVSTVVLEGPLSGDFLISGISQEDAQAFLNLLNANNPDSGNEE